MTRGVAEKFVPVASIVVFAFCFLAAIGSGWEERGFDIANLFSGLGAYFFAKGIFCSFSLYLAGKSYCVLLEIAHSRSAGGAVEGVDHTDS